MEDIVEEFPSLEVRHEAMKRVFQSLEQENDGRTSRLETSRMPDSDRAKVSGFDKDECGDLNANPQEVFEKRVPATFNRLSYPNMATVDVLDMPHDKKPKIVPSDEDSTAGKAYFFPELRSLIEDKLEEAKVETLSNHLERELARR